MLLLSTSKVDKLPVEDKSPYPLATYYTWAILFLLLAGTGFRLFHFVDNRSLWVDEIYLNINFVKKDFIELLSQPMEYEQKAPLGYLVMVKLAVLVFGKGEMGLRIFSLFCGIGSLVLFLPVAFYFLKPWTVVMALGVLALGEPSIYHAVEAKQYSTELFASILAFYLFITFQHSLKWRSLLVWGVSGGVLLWFSTSLIFILAGLGIARSVKLMMEKKWSAFFHMLVPFSIWFISFACIFYLYLGEYQEAGWLMNFFDVICHGFMPLAPSSLEDFSWYLRTPYIALHHPLGLLFKFSSPRDDYSLMQTIMRMPFLPLVLGGLGIIGLFRNNKYKFYLVTLPITLVLLASGLQLYPFYERFVLFLVPLFIILISYGAERIPVIFNSTHENVVALILLFLVLSPPAWNAVRSSTDPGKFTNKEYNREAVLYVNDRYQAGDVVYFYWNMDHAYKFYQKTLTLKYTALGGNDLRQSSGSEEEYYARVIQDIGDLKGKRRLWVIYNTFMKDNIGDYVGQKPQWYHKGDFSLGSNLKSNIAALGFPEIESFKRGKFQVTLYDLTDL